MRLSDQRPCDLYEAIRGPIVDLRVDIMQLGVDRVPTLDIDERLFALELEIWKRISKALLLTNEETSA